MGHDAWLGSYARYVSTEPYYQVCADLIAEVMQLFDSPRLFHLGMDEEAFDSQRSHDYVTIGWGNRYISDSRHASRRSEDWRLPLLFG
jgi:hypothetical protein